jgi:signal transduction histidine kinase/ActR/RegA family two-component response regulator
MKRARLWQDLPLGIKGLVVVAIPLLSLIASVVTSYFVTQQNTSNEVFVATYLQEVHTDVQSILFLVQDAETGVRSYLLTGKGLFLRRFDAAERDTPALLSALAAEREKLSRDDLGFPDADARGAAAVLRELPSLGSLDRDMGKIIALTPHRLSVLESLVAAGPVPQGSQSEGLILKLERRVPLTQTLYSTSKHIQPQLLALSDRAAAAQADRRARKLQLILVLAALGLVGGLASIVLFTRTISRRIALLESGAAVLAAGEPLPPLPVGRDAIGRLAERVQETSHLLAERDTVLRAAKEEADRANKAKSDFLSRMSHELRTPLNGILGFGQLLQMENLKPRQKRDLDQIVKAGNHLLGLINEVLDIASVEAGRVTLSIEPVQVDDVINDAVELVTPIAGERGIDIRVRQGGPETFASGDRQRLKQVLLNLISNAVKYNRPRGSVEVTVTEEEGLRPVIVSVSDDGIGIAPERLGRLFVPFDRLGAEQAGVEGTGLGLALSERLVHAMGGVIEVESEVGKGSTFRVRLHSAPRPSAGGTGDPSREGLGVKETPARTVLYVEDNPANLQLVKEILGYRPNLRLESAVKGHLGLELAKQQRYDLVLLDLDLPDISGVEVLRRLRSDPETRDVPVVIVTADATDGQADRLMAEGAAAYVSKPFDVGKLLAVIDGVLDRAAVT